MTKKPRLSETRTGTNAGPHRFDVAALRDVAGEKIFARGAVYHEDGRVEIVTFDRTRVLARVVGTEVYRCQLVGAGKKLSGECSCPAFSDWGFCEHLVATALVANGLGALKIYTERVERMLVLGGQSNYANAYERIERMRRLREGLGETMQHAAYLDDRRSRHKAKRNLMKLLTADHV